MSTLVEIQCPHCQSTAKLKSRDPLGKKVKCPKCAKPFVAKERRRAPAPVDDYEEYEPTPAPARRPRKRPKPQDEFDEFDDFGGPDDYGADDDFDDYQDRPRKSSRRKKPVKKKKRNSAGWLKWVLIGGGCALGLTLVGLGIWLVVGMFGSKSLDLAWLPEDANRISVIRYGNLMKADMVKEDIDGDTQSALDKMKEDWGFGIKDIKTFTSASSSEESIRVLRTTVDLDPDMILKHAGEYEKTTYDGENLYRFGRNAVFFPDKRTAVSGTEVAVKKAIDRGPKAEKREDLAFVDAGYDILYVKLFNQSSSNVSSSSGIFSNAIFGGTSSRIDGKSTGVSVSSSTFTYHHRTKFSSAEDAAEHYKKTQEIQSKFKKTLNNEKLLRSLPEAQRKEMRELANSMSFSFSRSGDVIKTTIKFTLPKSMRSMYMPFGSDGATRIKSAVRSPGRFFGFSSSRIDPRDRIRNQIRNIPRIQNRPVNRTVRKYEIRLNNFNGNGNPQTVVKTALNRVPGIDAARTQVNGNSVMVYSLPGQYLSTSRIRSALRTVGFSRPTVLSRGTEQR